MCKVSVYDVKTNLSKYLEMLDDGTEEEILITRYDKKIAVIKKYKEDENTKRLGAAIGILPELPFCLNDEEMNDEISKEFGY